MPVTVPPPEHAARLHAAVAAVKRVGADAPSVVTAFAEIALAFGANATLLLACTELPLVHAAASRVPRHRRAFARARLEFVDASALLAEALARRSLGLDGESGGGGARQGGGRPETGGPSFLKKV